MLRLSSRTPSSSSSDLTCLATVLTEDSSRAAAEKLPASTTLMKVLMRVKSSMAHSSLCARIFALADNGPCRAGVWRPPAKFLESRASKPRHARDGLTSNRIRKDCNARSDDREPARSAVSDAERVQQWLSAFEDALRAGDSQPSSKTLFVEESHWRDLFAFTWNVTPIEHARDAIVSTPAARAAARAGPRFQDRGGTYAAASGQAHGSGGDRGDLPVPDGHGRCLGVLAPAGCAARQGVDDQHVAAGAEGPRGAGGRQAPGRHEHAHFRRARRGADDERASSSYEDREPAVLIVGGGHNGLVLSARLRMLGVDSLVVERLPECRRRLAQAVCRTGAAQRDRPEPHAVHAVPGELAQIPAQGHAGRLARGVRHGRWSATSGRARRSSKVGTTRRAGVGRRACGAPTAPSAYCIPVMWCSPTASSVSPRCRTRPGLSDFKGQVVHAQGFDSGAPWRGKNVLVLGVGNSAHDIAQDLHGHGAKVKMIQRGSICVFSVKAASSTTPSTTTKACRWRTRT